MGSRAVTKRRLAALDVALKAMFQALADTTPPHLAKTLYRLEPRPAKPEVA